MNDNEEKDSEFQFITETIKDKPLDKKRLMERMLMTLASAALFGGVAAVVFSAIVKPMMPNNNEIRVVSIPADENSASTSEESDGSEDAGVSENAVSDNKPTQIINNITEKVSLTTEDYKELYKSLGEAADEAERSIVTVTGVASDTDWFENTVKDSSTSAGVIVANNGRELLILVDSDATDKADTITVTFKDSKTAEAEIKKVDYNTGLEIIAVPMDSIDEDTMGIIAEAKLGDSKTESLTETPVMAVGRPLGSSGTAAYGLITTSDRILNGTDRNFHLVSTDIYGSTDGSGAIFNYEGEVLGIISQKAASKDVENLISGYCISDLKEIIEDLSNGKSAACLGIEGTDVTASAHKEYDVPYGAYVKTVVMGSPAMNAGIQSGDVITKIGTMEIKDFSDYTKAIAAGQPEDDAIVTIQRYARGEYTEMTFDVTYTTLSKSLTD
ncbi:MAG: S1C family serine protease [Lachnospiraceae bacterium]|nr:S1C family serine protease [Lachnospiraceae bacterium]